MSADPRRLRVLFVLPGLHRVARGAEAAFESVARELGRDGAFQVTLIGSGRPRPGEPYEFLHASCIDRKRFERFPRVPLLRTETVYEELTFVPGLLRRYDPAAYDVTVGCSYPFVNWTMRARRTRGARPAHVYVTENGDWPCHARNSEYRHFACDGLVCVNPDHFERSKDRWRCVLLPNGVDPSRFTPGPAQRARFGIPERGATALMVSALIPSKRVVEGIRAVSALPGVRLVVAGDGPLRGDVDRAAAELMPGRFQRIAVARDAMPHLYRSVDVFLHMSKDESSPNAFAEALATGVPVVAHDDALGRWTFERLGELVDVEDLAAVGRAVERAVRAPPERKAELVSLAARRFAWSGIARQYADFLRDVVADRRGRGAASAAGIGAR